MVLVETFGCGMIMVFLCYFYRTGGGPVTLGWEQLKVSDIINPSTMD